MKVIIYFPKRYGGVKDVCDNLILGLKDLGVDVVEVTSHRTALNILLQCIFLKDKRLIHISNLEFGYINLFVKKSIYILHGIPERTSYRYFRYLYSIFLFKLFSRFATKVVSVSHFTKYVWLKFFGINTDVVIHNPLPRTCNQNSTAIYNPTTVRYIYVGRIIKEKGIYSIFKAFELFLKKNPNHDIELLFLGKGPELEQLKSVNDKLNNNKIKVLGYVDEDLKQNLIANSNVFISLHSGEPFGITSAEAGFHGLDLIVSSIGGHHEFIKNERLILVSDISSINEVLNAIIISFNNAIRRLGLPKSSSLLADNKLNLRQVSIEYLLLIKKILNET